MWSILAYNILIHLVGVYGSEETNLILPKNNAIETNKYNTITNCIIAISNRELFFRPTVAILDQTSEGNEENAFINELIDKLTENNIPQLILKDVLNEESHDLHINSVTVAFFNTCEDVKKFDFTRVDKDMRFLIIISHSTNDGCVEKLEHIGERVSKHAVTFIIQDYQTDQNAIVTIFSKIDGNTCEEVVDKPTRINTCVNGTIEDEEIFPTKNFENLNKCPFRVGMATLFPFATIPNVESLNDYDYIDLQDIKGSDFEIMKIITDYFNATLEIHYIYRREANPYANKGWMKFLLNGSLDVCAGGLYRIYGDVVEYSGVYVRQSVFWVYYAQRADRSWENLVSKLNDVYYFFIFYITYSFVWCLISLFDRESVSLITTLLNGWGALVGATSLQDARSNKQKFLNLMYLIMCIYSSAYISMQFYSFLTIRPPPHLLKTNSDVMTSGRTPYLMNTSKYFVQEEKYTKFADTSEDCVTFDDCAEKTLKYNGLTVILQGNFYIFQAMTAVQDEARVLRATENMLTVYNEMILRKNSPLVARFQSVMQRLFEAGITRRLFNEGIGISWVAKSTSANTNMVTSSYSCQAGCSITLMQFAGVFYAWIFGCVISCLIFLIEIMIKREKRLEFVN